MNDIRNYIDIVTAQTAEPVQYAFESHRLYQLAGLREGELIPYPSKMLRIAGSPLDFYQLLKMTANANLAHKVTYKQTGNKAGTNITEVLMLFYDDQSFAETKELFDHYGIAYTHDVELDTGVGANKQRFQSQFNPPDDSDLLHG